MDPYVFDRLMGALAPFETSPNIAVAVSGGGDSMALCLLAGAWVRQIKGRVTAVTVDHGLRAESAAEARQVGQWLGEHDIPHVTLRWEGPKPRSRLQAAARQARYGLLEAWCRDAGILHLLLGHTQDDQAETVLMRAGRATGVEGLAGMSAIVERQHVRILRPLLGLTRESLRVLLGENGLSWIEDVSNNDEAFTRVRVRRAIAAAPGVSSRLNMVAEVAGRARAVMEAATAAAGACCVHVHPAGFARLNLHAFRALPNHLARLLLARLTASVGGRESLAKRESVVRAQNAIAWDPEWRGLTLSGCRLIHTKGDQVLICREDRNLPIPESIQLESPVVWDNRFVISVSSDRPIHSSLRLAPLGRLGWEEIKGLRPSLAQLPIPSAVRCGLPALWDEGGVLEVPHMAYRNAGGGEVLKEVLFRPAVSLAALGYRVAPGVAHTT